MICSAGILLLATVFCTTGVLAGWGWGCGARRFRRPSAATRLDRWRPRQPRHAPARGQRSQHQTGWQSALQVNSPAVSPGLRPATSNENRSATYF